MPLMRMAFVILIFVVAALVVLSELGVNITPLIAAASVFGLALSFGSQTLVRDIVSGIFYLADDAFRVGEYIDCGKAKGTVEGFTLRSIKLRHQNGQVYHDPLRSAWPDHQFQQGLDDDEIQFALCPQHGRRETA